MSLFKSFRVRIALLSAAFSGLVLAAFGGLTLAALYQDGLSRLDSRLTATGYRLANEVNHPSLWTKDSPYLANVMEANPGMHIRAIIQGKEVFRTQDWPAEIAPEPTATTWHSDTSPDLRPGNDDGGRRETGQGRPHPPPRHNDHNNRQPPRQNQQGRPPDQHQQFQFNPDYLRFTTSLETVKASGESFRQLTLTGGPLELTIADSTGRVRRELSQMRSALLLALPMALLLIGLGGWVIAQRALRPVGNVARLAEEVTAEELHQRLPVSTEDIELQRLVQVFNHMLDRLERSFQQANRFSADAAHELKTPLTVLQGELEQALQEAPVGSDSQQMLGRLLGEVQRLKSIVLKLLMLAQADSGRLALNKTPYDLSAALDDILEDMEFLAPDLDVQTDVGKRIVILADHDLIRQVIQNMLTNAIRYNKENGLIRIKLEQQKHHAVLTVANTGEFIPASDAELIFDRFYRANLARDRSVDGVGLGLSLSREIMRAHQGEIELVPNQSLVTFRATMPLAPESMIETVLSGMMGKPKQGAPSTGAPD